MRNKRARRLYTKLVILIICLLIVVRLFTLVLSRYENISNTITKVDVAFYLLNEDYKTMTTNLSSIYPKDGVYVYTFSIGNEEGTKRAETDLTYDLKIRTTTNLPLTYELYKNQKYTDTGAKNIVKEDITKIDEHGTYFKTMTTNQEYLKYEIGTTNTYQLVVNFPKIYNEESYQDILEMIEITIDAKQVTSRNIKERNLNE